MANSIDCPIMTLIETQFHVNEASVAGGAVFAGYSEAIRFRCNDASPDSGLSFREEKEWRSLDYPKSVDDICSSWKTNNTATLYGNDVGTYATAGQMTIKNDDKSVCVSGEENCVIKGYRSGTILPPAEVILLDGLRQGPAISFHPLMANMSSPSGQFLANPIIIQMEQWTCTFLSIISFTRPGEYNLTVEFGEKTIKNIGLTVRIDDCSVGEMVSAAEFCVNCSSTTYNFLLSADVCNPCPENGNCESQVITPEDGYWQQMPCSDHLHRCLPTSACVYENRSDILKTKVRGVSSCDFKENWIEDYTQAQCAKVRCIAQFPDILSSYFVCSKRVTRVRFVDPARTISGLVCLRSARSA